MREKLCEVWPIYVMCLHLSSYLYGITYDTDTIALERFYSVCITCSCILLAWFESTRPLSQCNEYAMMKHIYPVMSGLFQDIN